MTARNGVHDEGGRWEGEDAGDAFIEVLAFWNGDGITSTSKHELFHILPPSSSRLAPVAAAFFAHSSTSAGFCIYSSYGLNTDYILFSKRFVENRFRSGL